MITRDPNGKIVWFETGNEKSGLQHIIHEHGSEFHGKGIKDGDIPDYVLEAVYQGHIVGTQGKRNPRTIYEFTYNGEKQRIASKSALTDILLVQNIEFCFDLIDNDR